MSEGSPAFEFRAEARDGYVFVWQSGLVRTQQELEELQREVERCLAATGTRLVMFDNRETQAPDAMLRAAMWTWLSEKVDRAAMIQAVAKNVRRADRTAERNRLAIRAFEDEADAERWLLRDG